MDHIRKKSRKSITLETKVKMIKLFDEGVGINEISKMLKLARSTIYTVLRDKQKYLDELKSSTHISTTKIRKDSLIADMEKFLNVWINDQISRNRPLPQCIIQKKAQTLFDEMKARREEADKADTFSASKGWFRRFKKRSNLFNIEGQGKPEDAESFSREIADIIKEGGYTKDQIFNVDETGLFWKKMPSKTFIAREEQVLSGFTAGKDRLTLLLGVNCSGKCKLKPMVVYNAENPRVLKNYDKASLPVYWRSNRKACVTAAVFEDWLENLFIPEVKSYCKDNNIPFKILLILDNSPVHPRSLENINSDIKVIFLPPNTTTMLQPLNQNVITAFKHYYLMRTFKKLVDAKESDEESGQVIIQNFWNNFNILDGIKTITDAWADISIITLQNAWKNLCPQLVDDFEDSAENPLLEVTENIVDMAKKLELEVDAVDIADLMESHSQPLTNEDLLELDEEKYKDIGCEEASEDETPGLTVELLSEGLRHFETGMAFFEKHDPNVERSLKLKAKTLKNYACYYEMLWEKRQKLTRQTTVPSSKRSVSAQNLALPSISRNGSFHKGLDIDESDCEFEDEENCLKKDIIRNKKHRIDYFSNYEKYRSKHRKIQEDCQSNSSLQDKITQMRLSLQANEEVLIFVRSISSQIRTLPKSVCNRLFAQINDLIDTKTSAIGSLVNSEETSSNCGDGVFEEIFIKNEIDIHESNVQ